MRYVNIAGLIVVGLVGLAYATDFAVVRIPIPRDRVVFGTVTVRPTLDVGLKSGKTDLYFLDPRKQTCVNSIFPQLGYTPCWYLRKHTHPVSKM